MLDPQARALLDLMDARGVPPTHTLTPTDARRFYRERRFFSQPDPPAVAELRELKIPGPAGAVPCTAVPAAAGRAPGRRAAGAGVLPRGWLDDR